MPEAPSPAAPSADDLRQIDALLDAAFDVEPADLPAFLDAQCPPHLRERVERMLDSLRDSTAGFATGAALAKPFLDSAAESDDDGLPAGSRIGPYRIVGKLGRGGMGYVYLAERDDGQFEQRVALKLAHLGRRDPEQARRRFALERQILAGLEHPNIARLLDGGVEEDGSPWFAMEVVIGRTLADHCDAQRLGVRGRLQLFVKVARAVAAAHRQLIVHRDLKPSNILVTDDGTVKLLDFGIAKLLDEDLYGEAPTGLTRTQQMVLTPEYAAPEQFLGEPVTTATDVYQLGLLLYELLTGKRPYDFQGLSRMQAQLRVCSEQPAKPSTAVASQDATVTSVLDRRATTVHRLRRALSGDLDTVILKALRREPERRYLSADDLADDLERFLGGHPISARPDSLGYRTRKFVRRHLGAVVASAAALLVLVTLVAYYTVRLRSERDLARREAIRANLVSDFLTDVFGGADPYQNQGEAPSALDLLAEGAQRLESLDAEPEVHADLGHLIGKVYARLGDFAAARPLLDAALAERQALHGDDHPKVADTLYELASVDEQAGEYERALERAQQALAVRQDGVASVLDLAATWNRIAYIERQLLRYDESWQSGHTALALLDESKTSAAEDFETQSLRLEVLSGLGYVAQRRGEQTAALELFLRARDLAESWGEEHRRHPNVARVYRNLGGIYGRLDERAKSRAANETALAIYEQVLPDDHPELAGLLINLGETLVIAAEPEAAAPMLERAVAICRKHLGEDHLHTALALINLSNARSQLGEHGEAMELHEHALGILRRAVGEDHPMYVHALGFGGELMRRAGDARGALERHNLALARAEVVFGPDHPELAQMLEEQARTLEDLGRYHEAAASVRRQLAVRAPHLPPDSDVPQRLTERAEALERRGG